VGSPHLDSGGQWIHRVYSRHGLRGSSSGARKSEVERLHGAVAKLADLVGGIAPQNREVKAAVSEIIASVGGI